MNRLIPVLVILAIACFALTLNYFTPVEAVPVLQAPAEYSEPSAPAKPVLGITVMPPEVAPVPFVFPPVPKPNGLSGGCAQYIQPLTRMAQEVFGINAPVARFAAQLDQESACQRGAISSAGARGLAQMMPATANLLARRYPELRPVDVHDPNWSIRAQLYLMRDLLDQYDGARSECDQWQFAWAAYNGGERALMAEQALAPDRLKWMNSVQPQRKRSQANWNENRGYVRAIPIRERRMIAAGVNGSAVCT